MSKALSNSRPRKGFKISLSKRFVMYTIIGLLTASLIAGLGLTVLAYRTPTHITKESVTSELILNGRYSYSAHVKPAIIYNNATMLREDTPLYLRLVKDLSINFIFRASSPQRIRTLKGSLTTEIAMSSYTWRKVYEVTGPQNFTSHTLQITYKLNVTDLLSEMHQIEEEISSRSGDYNVTLTPHVKLMVVLVNGEKFSKVFTPTLTLIIKSTSPVLYISNLNKEVTYTQRKVETYESHVNIFGFLVPVNNLRVTSLIISSASAPLLAFAILRTKNGAELKSELQRIMEKYGDEIIGGKVNLEGNATLIDIGNFKRLLELADKLARPIVRDGKHFYVVENGTIYHYVASEEKVKRISEK